MVKKKALLFLCLISICFTCAFAFDFHQASPTLLASNPYQSIDGSGTSGHYRANVSWAGAGGTNPSRSLYYVDGIFPLYYSKDGDMMLFYSPKQNWHEPYAEETNMGLGFRAIYNDSILVMHFFYDKSYTPNKVWHEQSGTGI
jgi:hypothetical protein